VPRYADKTNVSAEQSRMEIERILRRYGAKEFAYATKEDRAMIGFSAQGRYIKIMLPIPNAGSREFQYTPARQQRRSPQEAEKAWEQACRQRWRALALLIKAKLEAVESGIITFEAEFESYTVLPDGRTVGEFIQPQITAAYERGEMPPLLPEF
jgi:hypothetical protein